MVLLISNSKSKQECVVALEKSLGEQVISVASLQQAGTRLRTGEYSVIIVDQSWAGADPTAADSLWRLAGAAPVLSVNFAISSVERIARDVKAALARRQHEQLHATRAAQAALRNELTGAISGILLSSELALAQPALPTCVVDKLKSVYQLALEIKSRLGSVDDLPMKL